MKNTGLSKILWSSRDGYPDLSTPCTCCICGKRTTFGDMRKSHTGGRFVIFAACKTCQNANCRQRQGKSKSFARTMRMRYAGMKHNAARSNVPFALSFRDFLQCWEESDKKCPILGTNLDLQGGRRGADPDCLPSLDKIIPELGYVPGNIRFISATANRMKQNVTEEQAVRILAYIKGEL